MPGFILVGLTLLIASEFSQSLNTKLDFGEEEPAVVTDSSKENEDVEVQHTIVVSTKLKNNNRRGLQNSRDDHINNSGRTSNIKREDSGEVPVVKGYKAVETTQIFTPETRAKTPVNNVNSFTRHNPDDYDFYPNLGLNPVQFTPSNYYNNINWWNQENPRNYNSFIRSNDRTNLNAQKSNFNRRMNDDRVRDFYCTKCRELNGRPGLRGCELRSNLRYENTTPKLKIDGKLAKLT